MNKHTVGDLDKVSKVVKIFGVVNSANDFTQQATVMNGFSDFFHKVFGDERGRHGIVISYLYILY
jgi:enamine deaminase RidA (YjgF/YER057c/UK114 family)